MTEEQILSLVEEYFVELNPFCGFTTKEYTGKLDDFVKFAEEIRRQTRRDILHEIIARLSSAPNAEVNQPAIILIEKQLFSNDRKRNPKTCLDD